MRLVIYGVFWVLVYLTLTLLPLFVLLVGPVRPGRGFWTDFSVALGFAGLAMLGLQFLLTARFRSLSLPYGIDVVYHFHRQISILTFFLVLFHPLILFAAKPDTLALLALPTAPWRAQAGVISIVLLFLLIATSVWRLQLKISYEIWRLSHAALAIAVVVLAVIHVLGVGYYVASPWKRALWTGMGVGWIGMLVYVRFVKPLNMFRKPYVVECVFEERGNSWTVVLRPDGHKGMRFLPGQFAWLTVDRTPFSVREHPFSFSSSAMESEYIGLTIKALGDFTSRIKDIKPGTRAYLDGPYGGLSIDKNIALGYLFVAGGIGITPFISILRTMADRRDTRPVTLIYGSKDWEQVTFREELEGLKQRMNIRVVHVLDNPPDDWDGETGMITPEMLSRYLPDNRFELQYFVCGPVPMMNAVEDALRSLGIPLERYQSERFNLV